MLQNEVLAPAPQILPSTPVPSEFTLSQFDWEIPAGDVSQFTPDEVVKLSFGLDRFPDHTDHVKKISSSKGYYPVGLEVDGNIVVDGPRRGWNPMSPDWTVMSTERAADDARVRSCTLMYAHGLAGDITVTGTITENSGSRRLAAESMAETIAEQAEMIAAQKNELAGLKETLRRHETMLDTLGISLAALKKLAD